MAIVNYLRNSGTLLVFKNGKFGYTYDGKVFLDCPEERFGWIELGTVKEYYQNGYKNNNINSFNVVSYSNDLKFSEMDEFIKNGDHSKVKYIKSLKVGAIVKLTDKEFLNLHFVGKSPRNLFVVVKDVHNYKGVDYVLIMPWRFGWQSSRPDQRLELSFPSDMVLCIGEDV